MELAQYKYLLPRLLGMWTHLERQEGPSEPAAPARPSWRPTGGISAERSPSWRTSWRTCAGCAPPSGTPADQNEVPVVAIVGYTNAGKSTLLNKLTGADIPANNRLFDTLDTTTRTLEISDTCTVLLSDTVGFIRKLPHHLVEAFKATLEELPLPTCSSTSSTPPTPVAGAGGGGGAAHPGAGGGAPPPHRRVQQVRQIYRRHPPPGGGHRVHLGQDRPGAGRAAEENRRRLDTGACG